MFIYTLLLAIFLNIPAEQLPTVSSGKSPVLIEAKARADDLVKAYEAFKKEQPTFRVAARLANGTSLSNILELSAMPNGTLFLVKLSSPLGTKLQIIPVDEIVDFYFQ